MAREWPTLTVDEIKAPSERSIAIGPFGSRMKADAYVPAGVPVIRGTNISDTRALVGDFVFVSDQTADELYGCNVRAGDLVFPHRGAIGQVAIVPTDSFERYMLSSSLMKLSCDRQLVEPQFIFYFFRSSLGRYALLQHASTVGTPGIGQPLASLRSIRIPIPSLPEQRAIAHILGTLDDKIELNRRMNETLEAMARALFKSWFVDFDPVRAKAEGRDPGLPQPLADLFPNSFEDSEIGKIPRGWEVGALGELIDTVKGRSYKSEELIESDTALVTLKSFARGGGYRPDGLKPFAGTYKPEQIVTPGDLVIACTDVTQAAEVIGRPAIVRGTSGYRRLVASLDTLIVRPRHSSMTRAFLYFLGGTEAFVAHTYAHTTGTTVLHLAKEAVPSFTFARPSTQLVERFDSLASPTLDRIQALEEESGTLAGLRDALLPKLISGELRIRDAERTVAEV